MNFTDVILIKFNLVCLILNKNNTTASILLILISAKMKNSLNVYIVNFFKVTLWEQVIWAHLWA